MRNVIIEEFEDDNIIGGYKKSMFLVRNNTIDNVPVFDSEPDCKSLNCKQIFVNMKDGKVNMTPEQNDNYNKIVNELADNMRYMGKPPSAMDILPHNRIIIFQGSSGSGKTTLINKILQSNNLLRDNAINICIDIYEEYYDININEIILILVYSSFISPIDDENIEFIPCKDKICKAMDEDELKNNTFNNIIEFNSHMRNMANTYSEFPRLLHHTTKETTNNKNSSRSHAIVAIYYTIENKTLTKNKISLLERFAWETLILVDCIGGEDIPPGLIFNNKITNDAEFVINNPALVDEFKFNEKFKIKKNLLYDDNDKIVLNKQFNNIYEAEIFLKNQVREYTNLIPHINKVANCMILDDININKSQSLKFTSLDNIAGLFIYYGYNIPCNDETNNNLNQVESKDIININKKYYHINGISIMFFKNTGIDKDKNYKIRDASIYFKSLYFEPTDIRRFMSDWIKYFYVINNRPYNRDSDINENDDHYKMYDDGCKYL